MANNKICTTCNKKCDKDNYKKDRTVCRSCCNKNKGKNNNNTSIQNQPPKVDNVDTNNNQ